MEREGNGMKEAADVLAESREYLEEHGWCRGAMQDYLGNVCSMGAICYSQHWANKSMTPFELNLFKTVCQALMQVIAKETGFRHDIPQWNDSYARDKQEVLDLFMKAEKQARSGNVEES